MSNKKFILNADDFGMSKAFNKAVLDGYNLGFLKSTSLCANGKAFEAAVNEIIPECQNLSIGAHLNIIEGHSLLKHAEIPLLVNSNNKFNNGYFALISKSNNKDFLSQVENEFRAQIEKILKYTKIDHLDSHVHTHAIPNIFKIVCKLAKEYGISNVRTQYENFYLTPDVSLHLNLKYPPNILKVILLNNFSKINKETINSYGLKTNDYIIGVGYTGMMNDKTIYHGLSSIKSENIVVEALIHPCSYEKEIKNQHFIEFLITTNSDLKDKVERLGFEISNYKD